MHSRYFLRARSLALQAERSHRRPDRAAVAWIFHALREPVRLEPVHELGDIGAHAGHLRGAFAQADRLAGFHEVRQRAELRKRQPDLRQSFFEALLDGMPGVDKGKHQLAVLLALAVADAGAAFIHI